MVVQVFDAFILEMAGKNRRFEEVEHLPEQRPRPGAPGAQRKAQRGGPAARCPAQVMAVGGQQAPGASRRLDHVPCAGLFRALLTPFLGPPPEGRDEEDPERLEDRPPPGDAP